MSSDTLTALEDAIQAHVRGLYDDEGEFAVAWVLIAEVTSPEMDACDMYDTPIITPDGQRRTHTRGLLHEGLSDMSTATLIAEIGDDDDD